MKNEIILGNGNIGMFPCVLDSESHSSDVALIFVKLPIVKEVGEFSQPDEVEFNKTIHIDDPRIVGAHIFSDEKSIDNLIEALNDTKKMMIESRCLTADAADTRNSEAE